MWLSTLFKRLIGTSAQDGLSIQATTPPSFSIYNDYKFQKTIRDLATQNGYHPETMQNIVMTWCCEDSDTVKMTLEQLQDKLNVYQAVHPDNQNRL